MLVIGNNIKEFRTKKIIKGETLAKTLGVSKAAVSQMEHGLTDFKVSTLYEMANIFEVDVRSLIVSETLHSSQQSQNKISLEKTVLIDQLFDKIDSLNEQITALKLEK